MDMRDITDKEIQYNIMIALMQISGNFSDLVSKFETVDYMTQDEVIADDPSGSI